MATNLEIRNTLEIEIIRMKDKIEKTRNSHVIIVKKQDITSKPAQRKRKIWKRKKRMKMQIFVMAPS